MAYSVIKKPSDYFDGKTYLGSASAVTVTGLNFQPDLVWVKDRDNGNNHCLVDAVRGTGKYISSDLTSAETNNATNSISAFNSDGFTTGTANPANEAASTTKGFMSWNWLASNTTASNTDGSITSTVSANTTSGFSIVSYTGTGSVSTIGHGLGSTPACIIIKNRTDITGWTVYHKILTGTSSLGLDTTNTTNTGIGVFNNTDPTSSVFTVGTANGTNGSGDSMIAYCFAEKQGFSKFGSWTGADGAFIYTGFKPAFILGKNATNSAGYDWWTFDNKRDSFNDGANNLLLRPNAADAEQTITFAPIDFLSNGFKIYGTDNTVNGSGETMIYMAFAEEPLVGDNPATAR